MALTNQSTKKNWCLDLIGNKMYKNDGLLSIFNATKLQISDKIYKKR